MIKFSLKEIFIDIYHKNHIEIMTLKSKLSQQCLHLSQIDIFQPKLSRRESWKRRIRNWRI